jgi:predicted nucleic acid-binding protein
LINKRLPTSAASSRSWPSTPDLPADFADASLVALCERRGIEHIATFDKDFLVYRMADNKSLTNVIATR